MSTRGIIFLCVVLLIGTACEGEKKQEQKSDQLSVFKIAEAQQTGLSFSNNLKDALKLNIIEYLYYYNGAGVGVGDLNNDGLEDIYFAANQKVDELYFNKGNLKFEKASSSIGLDQEPSWSTGVSIDDVNGDGHLDIYVCKVGLIGENVHNLLYINNGDGTFVEKSKEYGLDFSGYATQACFLDYDRDGDLDVYLLNHTVHSVRSYGDVKKRNQKDELSGDRFYENRLKEEGKFVEVTEAAGIYNSPLGYGLAVACADVNNDGWIDIYVGNDFHENDYLYLNNGDKTFTESNANTFTHTSQFSMGVDLADLNNDGWLDLFTTDMLPYQREVALQSAGEDTDEIKRIKDNLGFEKQYARNHLQINQKNGTFSDIAYLTGTFATDWSWSVLLEDFDNNGLQDIFISNGIVRRPNDLDYINYLNDYDEAGKSTEERTQNLIANMPSQPLQNILFSQTAPKQFTDVNSSVFGPAGFSTGAAIADFDQDGDVDLVINNINEKAAILENTSFDNNYLTISLSGTNVKGTKVSLFSKEQLFYRELQTVQGFMSSGTHQLHFGLGQLTEIDSIQIVWPDQKVQILTDVKLNQRLEVKKPGDDQLKDLKVLASDKIKEALVFPFKHSENNFFDENQEKLIPERLSYEGPALLYEDLDGDGIKDIFFGGARNQEARLLLGKANGSFSQIENRDFFNDSKYEDIDAASIDFDGDGDRDLYVVSGGSDNKELDKLMEDRLYLNNGGGQFKRIPISLPHTNGSAISVGDFNQDGYEDLFVGARSIPGSYGLVPYSFILKNLNGQGVEIAYKARMGMLTDGEWVDLDGDKDLDLLLCGDWMGISYYENNGNGELSYQSAKLGFDQYHGFWNTLAFKDFNGDGKLDVLAGNSGLNHKWQANDSMPIRLYVGDFDKNGFTDPLIFYPYFGKYIPFASLDKLNSQMPIFKKKFTTYQSFNNVNDIEDLISQPDSLIAESRKVNELRSMLWLSGNEKYQAIPLDIDAQQSDIQDFAFGPEGQVYYVGNNTGYVAELGAAISNPGGVLSDFDTASGQFKTAKRLPLPLTINARSVEVLNGNKILVVPNNDYPHVLEQP